jgi:hypothetical protein
MRALMLSVMVLGSGIAVAADPLRDWAGVYKDRFKSANVDGESYDAENILEIAPVDGARAYVRADLAFFNGHSCAFRGVMGVEGDALVYRGPKDGPMGERCILTIAKIDDGSGKTSLVLSDEDARCASRTCGMRGGYEGIGWSTDAKRSIRYLARLRASKEYEQALSEANRR